MEKQEIWLKNPKEKDKFRGVQNEFATKYCC